MELDFGHSGIDPLQTRQKRAGAGQELGEVWWGVSHHEIIQPPMPQQLSLHYAIHHHHVYWTILMSYIFIEEVTEETPFGPKIRTSIRYISFVDVKA
jgi:hypothetical protein